MPKQMYTLRDVPRYDNLRAAAGRYPELEPASGALFVLLMRLSSDLLVTADKHLAKHGLSHGRYIVMMLLYRVIDEPQNPCVLAEKAGVTRATMTGLLDNLERAEYIVRETAPEDRRMLKVHMTTKGKRFLEGLMPGYFKLIRQCMAGLSTAEKEQMI